MNAWTAGLLLGALLLDKALAKRARASWRLALYVPVGLRLLLPPSWKIQLAHTPDVVTLLMPRPDVLLPTTHAPAAAPVFTWPGALAVAYVAVALAILLVRLRAYLSLRRELRSARLATAAAATASAPCPVLEHDVLGPMVVGTIRPRIVLPSLLLSADQADALACVIGHESAHVRRGDAWLMACHPGADGGVLARAPFVVRGTTREGARGNGVRRARARPGRRGWATPVRAGADRHRRLAHRHAVSARRRRASLRIGPARAHRCTRERENMAARRAGRARGDGGGRVRRVLVGRVE